MPAVPKRRKAARRRRIIEAAREVAKAADKCPQCNSDISTGNKRAAAVRWCDNRNCCLSRDKKVGTKPSGKVAKKPRKRAPKKKK